MDVREYMDRRCVCGQLRSHHAHFDEYEPPRKGHHHGRPMGTFKVLPVVRRNECRGFMDEIELELRGNPADNPLLSPLIAKEEEHE